jgi:DNA replication protein
MMRAFPGFPDRIAQTMVPTLWLRTVLAETESLAEIKVTLHVFRLLQARREHPRSVRVSELRGDAPTMASLAACCGISAADALAEGVRLAVARGTFLAVALEAVAGGDADRSAAPASGGGPAVGGPASPGAADPRAAPATPGTADRRVEPSPATETPAAADQCLLLNTPSHRRLVGRVAAGEAHLALATPAAVAAPPARRPTIYELYEQNVGLLTPLLVEDLREAADTYPPDWIEEAFREAVGYNRRNWHYVRRILETWATRGRGERGVAGGRPQTPRDPRRYFEGPYGSIVKR